MSLKNMQNKLTSTTSTKSLQEVEREEAFIRNKLAPEQKLQIKKEIEHPTIPVQAFTQEQEDETIARAHLPKLSKERLINRSMIDPAPDNWNFFGKPDKEPYSLLMNSIYVDGLMNPITLWKQPNDRYMILSGHTRDSVYDNLYQVTEDPKWLSIQAKYYDVDDITENDARRIIILANLAQRAKESSRIRIKSYGEYAKLTKAAARYGSGVDVATIVAQTFGIGRSSVFFYQRLSNLIDPILDLYCEGKIRRDDVQEICILPQELQDYLYQSDYIKEFDGAQFKALRHIKTKEDIDNIYLESKEAEIPTRKYLVSIPFKKPKNTEIVGLCIPMEQKEACQEIIRKAFESSSIDEKTKAFILSQLTNKTHNVKINT